MGNLILWTSLFSALLAQTIKLLAFFVRERKLNLALLVESGGMPSSHSSFVVCLCTSVGLSDGWHSSTFAIATVFALIVMYDARGVRLAAGMQARLLNRMIEEFEQFHTIQEKRLKELLGHTPKEVLVGAILGLFIALFFYTPLPLIFKG